MISPQQHHETLLIRILLIVIYQESLYSRQYLVVFFLLPVHSDACENASESNAVSMTLPLVTLTNPDERANPRATTIVLFNVELRRQPQPLDASLQLNPAFLAARTPQCSCTGRVAEWPQIQPFLGHEHLCVTTPTLDFFYESLCQNHNITTRWVVSSTKSIKPAVRHRNETTTTTTSTTTTVVVDDMTSKQQHWQAKQLHPIQHDEVLSQKKRLSHWMLFICLFTYMLIFAHPFYYVDTFCSSFSLPILINRRTIVTQIKGH